MIKITIVGDIICDKEMLKSAETANKKYYNFNNMFYPLGGYFNDSSYIICNLETPISNFKLTDSVFSFNNPEELIKSLKIIGINVFSLANNHVLDRGDAGLDSTIKNIKKYGLQYFGIDNNLYIDCEDCKVCLVGYTDSTNYHINKCLTQKKINLLKPQNVQIPRKEKNIFDKLYHKLSPDIRIQLKNIFKKKIKPIVDRCSKYDDLKEYIEPLEKNLNEVKKNGYYTIMYPHMGGQFNIEPGEYVLKMVNKFKNMGCDSVVITHPHIIQKMRKIDNTFCFYSIGGMIISPTSKFVLWETKPQYSLVLHYYFDKNKLLKITGSFLICVSDKESYLKVYPFYKYYTRCNVERQKELQSEFLDVYNRLFDSNKETVDIKDEYIIEEFE